MVAATSGNTVVKAVTVTAAMMVTAEWATVWWYARQWWKRQWWRKNWQLFGGGGKDNGGDKGGFGGRGVGSLRCIATCKRPKGTPAEPLRKHDSTRSSTVNGRRLSCCRQYRGNGIGPHGRRRSCYKSASAVASPRMGASKVIARMRTNGVCPHRPFENRPCRGQVGWLCRGSLYGRG